MEIDGDWEVRYSAIQEQPFDSEEGDPEEAATITLNEGKITGRDPFGYEYSGNYSLSDKVLKANVIATPYDSDAEPIFEEVVGQFTLDLEGEFNSPNFFSMRGKIVENPLHQIVLNCSRSKI